MTSGQLGFVSRPFSSPMLHQSLTRTDMIYTPFTLRATGISC